MQAHAGRLKELPRRSAAVASVLRRCARERDGLAHADGVDFVILLCFIGAPRCGVEHHPPTPAARASVERLVFSDGCANHHRVTVCCCSWRNKKFMLSLVGSSLILERDGSATTPPWPLGMRCVTCWGCGRCKTQRRVEMFYFCCAFVGRDEW